jgi:chemotaxis-related protein WspB
MLLLSLKAGANRYAIDVARIIELVPRVQLRVIPHAPPFLAGLLGYRGNVIPVIDLGLLLDSEPSRDCLSTRIILVNDAPVDHNRENDPTDRPSDSDPHSPVESASEMRLLGLIGEQVSELTNVQPEQLLPAPIELAQVPFLGAIVQTQAGIVQLISVERIRESSLGRHILGQGAAWNHHPSNADAGEPALEDSKADD